MPSRPLECIRHMLQTVCLAVAEHACILRMNRECPNEDVFINKCEEEHSPEDN